MREIELPPRRTNNGPDPRRLYPAMRAAARGLTSRAAIERRLFDLAYSAHEIASFLRDNPKAGRP